MRCTVYVVCDWSKTHKLKSRTILNCRLLNKSEGMKPTRELYLRSRLQIETRKCLTGPITGKYNGATPDAPRYNSNTNGFALYLGDLVPPSAVFMENLQW